MSTTQAKIAAKKLTETTGIPDELAEKMYHAEEAHYVAIVDLGWLDATHGLSEKKTVRLQIAQLEILQGDTAEHARQLMRAVYLTRQPQGLDGTDGENPDDIIARGRDALLTCPTCLHPHIDEAINHWRGDENEDGAFCAWKSDGTEVHPDQDDPGQAHTSQNPTSNEGPKPDTAAVSPLFSDQPKTRRRKTPATT